MIGVPPPRPTVIPGWRKLPGALAQADSRRCVNPRRVATPGGRLVGTVSRPGGRGAGRESGTASRKVGTPQSRVLANGQSGRLAGQCHRKETADGGLRPVQVRVKGCGKSAPATGVTPPAR